MSVEHIHQTRNIEHQRSTLPARHLAGVLLGLSGVERHHTVERVTTHLGKPVELGKAVQAGDLAGWQTSAQIETQTMHYNHTEGDMAVRIFAQRHDRRVAIAADRISGLQDAAGKVVAVEQGLTQLAQAMGYNYRPVEEGMTDFPPFVPVSQSSRARHEAA